MTYLESILKVLAVGLALGAGLPAIFAVGLVAFSRGAGGVEADGTVQRPNPALKFVGLLLFVFVAAVVLIAILYITKGTIEHHFGVNPVPFIPE
ncbi:MULTISPECIES: hypothetical protein [Mycobacteriaceae]|uniref:hypothetical protein n=1 Tax=Mycobacteriaceae TaxID=1762 RepID=UPI0007FCDB7A|nr:MULTISPECIES: hypothetical protein [Mycobacteriaceae]MCK0175787.1 hypothetical protein [Mycolicibacterium sp. F2034L]OBB60132.1 hypothetical protein A5757_10705 [Mycobacterium sp. 852013-51886_SCH5428379]